MWNADGMEVTVFIPIIPTALGSIPPFLEMENASFIEMPIALNVDMLAWIVSLTCIQIVTLAVITGSIMEFTILLHFSVEITIVRFVDAIIILIYIFQSNLITFAESPA